LLPYSGLSALGEQLRLAFPSVAKEVRLWRVDAASQLLEVPTAKLELESRLEDWLARDISVLDPGVLVIGRQVDTEAGPLDLLCLDQQGDLVIVELKRDRTPREITAQVLDYASCLVDMSHDWVRATAEAHIKVGLDEAFKEKFGAEVPETLNGGHRMLIVGSAIDPASERIIRYLSDTHGININAATFQYFRLGDGTELVTRVFFIEPSEVDQNTRRKGSQKRLPNLTFEELETLASTAGVSALYAYAVSSFGGLLRKDTTRSSMRLESQFDGSRRVVISLIPGDSDADKGLHFQLYKTRYAKVANIPSTAVEELMPVDHHSWAYIEVGDPDYEGFEGFLRTNEDVDRLTSPLKAAGVV
jgi:hypothetical protein